MDFAFSDIAGILGKRVKEAEKRLVITGFSTDTRTIEPGMMFIAIPGENFDGGDYVEKALEMGASGAITEKDIETDGVIKVENVIRALGKLALNHRSRFDIPVVAVTGSTGKTSTKNFIESVLSTRYNTHSTQGNLNNHIGLPMTLLKLEENHEASVIEMGMNNLGEIDYLAGMTKPDIGVITNIGMSHIGILGSRQNIFKAKTEIIPHINEGGLLVTNGDDEFLGNLVELKKPDVLLYGSSENSHIIFKDEHIDDNGCFSFSVDGEKFRLSVPGRHNIYNALAALAVGRELGLSYDEIRMGLLNFRQDKLRLEILEIKGIRIINDSYNASPDSMKAALDILADQQGRKIAVLGDMLEMGDFSKKAHTELGNLAADCADIIVCCGPEARYIAKGAATNGFSSKYLFNCNNSDEAAAIVYGILEEGDNVLVKGSRGMKMENVVKYIEAGGN